MAQGADAAQLRELARQLRRQADGKERLKQYRAELRAPAKAIQKDVRAGIRRIPSKGQSARAGRTPLRRLLSRSVTVQVRTSGRRAGVFVFMSPRKMPDGMKALPAYFEATPGYTRLRHPVWGNRDAWVRQYPHTYFTRATSAAQREAERAANRVIDRMARELESP